MKTKNKYQTQKNYKNALIKPSYILFIQLDRKSKD